MVAHRVVYVTILALGVLVLGGSAAAQSAPASSSSAFGVRVVLPGGAGETAGAVSAPPRGGSTLNGWNYRDGAVSAGWLSTAAKTSAASTATGSGSATIQSVSLFGGEITADAVFIRATARASGKGASGSLDASSVSNLVALGSPVQTSPNTRVALGDWGYMVVLEQAVVRQNQSRLGFRGFATGLHVVLTAAHGGLPAGTEIMVGYAEAAASARKAAPPPATPPPPPDTKPPAQGPPREPVPSPPGTAPPPVVQNPPQGVEPKLTAAGYVFPVYGPASFSDDFAAARAITGWHHGNDIFAPLGAPVLAVADGTLFLVGWNDVGGNRLWLRDAQGTSSTTRTSPPTRRSPARGRR